MPANCGVDRAIRNQQNLGNGLITSGITTKRPGRGKFSHNGFQINAHQFIYYCCLLWKSTTIALLVLSHLDYMTRFLLFMMLSYFLMDACFSSRVGGMS